MQVVDVKLKMAVVNAYIKIYNKLCIGHQVNLDTITMILKIIDGSRELSEYEIDFLISKLEETY